MVLAAYMLVLIFVWTGMAAKRLAPPCDQHMFNSNVENCLSDFNKSMETSGYQDSCPWPAVKSIYNKLMGCVEDWARKSWCKGYQFMPEKVFLNVHEKYFLGCGQVGDPPLTTLIMLIAPAIILILLLPLINFATRNIEMPCTLGLRCAKLTKGI